MDLEILSQYQGVGALVSSCRNGSLVAWNKAKPELWTKMRNEAREEEEAR